MIEVENLTILRRSVRENFNVYESEKIGTLCELMCFQIDTQQFRGNHKRAFDHMHELLGKLSLHIEGGNNK